MGTICFCSEGVRKVGEKPCPFSGLSEGDKVLIRKSWHKITEKDTFSKTGHAFFIRLFQVYPYLQDYFTGFKERGSVVNSLKFKAHAVKFIYAITAYVENLDDAETLNSLMTKVADSHCRRDITYDDMERMQEVFFEFLHDQLNKDCTPEVMCAWDKLFSTNQRIYADTWNKMIRDRKEQAHRRSKSPSFSAGKRNV